MNIYWLTNNNNNNNNNPLDLCTAIRSMLYFTSSVATVFLEHSRRGLGIFL